MDQVDPIRSPAAILGLPDQGKLKLVGEQALWFLDQLVTNKVDELEEGEGAEALLLTPKGRITTPMDIWFVKGAAYVGLPPGVNEQVASFFNMRIFATKVEIEDVTDILGGFLALGPQADETAVKAIESIALPEDAHLASVVNGELMLVRTTKPVPGLQVWAPRGEIKELTVKFTMAGGKVISDDGFDSIRVVKGIPRFGKDFDSSFLPQEAALESAIHFDKGCYLGQEAVAMAQRGTVKRRLRHLQFLAEPSLGDVSLDGEVVGSVTSVGKQDHRGFGIATVKTSVPISTEVRVANEIAVVKELPGTDQGPQLPSARELRERLKG